MANFAFRIVRRPIGAARWTSVVTTVTLDDAVKHMAHLMKVGYWADEKRTPMELRVIDAEAMDLDTATSLYDASERDHADICACCGAVRWKEVASDT